MFAWSRHAIIEGLKVALHPFSLFRIYRYLPLIASPSARVDHGSIAAGAILAKQRGCKMFRVKRALLRTNCAHSLALGLFGRLY